MEKKIDVSDFRVLTRLIKEIVALHIKYIKRGYTIFEIGKTFSEIYFQQFARALDGECESILNKEVSSRQRFCPLEAFDLSVSVCLKLSASFMDAVSGFLSKKPK